MLRLRRNPDGSPMIHETGQAARVEDDGGRALLSPEEWAELQAALAQTSQVVSPAGPVVADTPAGGATPPLQPENAPQAPTVQPRKGCHGPTDPVIVQARQRAAQAAAARAEAIAEEARLKLEQTRRRVYQDRAAGGDGSGRRGGCHSPAASGPGVEYRPPGDELEEAQRAKALAQARRDAAIADAEAEQARIASKHLTHKVEAIKHGTTGPHLFLIGFGGFVVGCILAVPLRAAFASAGNPGAGEVAGMALELAGIWFAVWARLRRVALERRAEEQRLERESVRQRMMDYRASR